MACFIVPTVEAAALTVAKKHIAKKAEAGGSTEGAQRSLDLVRKLTWLTNLLWGGAVLLAFEHLWHGEVNRCSLKWALWGSAWRYWLP